MQQYFIDNVLCLNKEFVFSKEQAHHISKVLRMSTKEQVKVVDAQGNPFMASLRFEAKDVYGTPIKEITKTIEKINVTLVQGMIKKEKWDFLIQKCCELGVSRIVPMISSRTIVKVDASDTKKIERYNKIAKEACEQCKRDSLAIVDKPISFREINNIDADLKLIAYEDASFTSVSLKEVLVNNRGVKDILYVIGSEGGFSEEEVSSLVEKGFICVSLGKRILRAETAAMSIAANISYEWE